MAGQLIVPPGRGLTVRSAVRDDPSVEIRYGLLVIGAFIVMIGGWAAVAPLDVAATGSGEISVSGHNEIIQHRDGGVVAAVDVSEGQHVRAGQVLVELAPEDAGPDVSSVRSQVISLQAQRARLIAEAEGAATIEWPASFATLSGADLAAAKEAMEIQQAQFDAGLGVLQNGEAINARHAAGLREQLAGSRGQLAAVATQQSLLNQQLAGMRTLAAEGYAPLNTVRGLERNVADLSGQRQQQAANMADYSQQIAQAGLESSNLVMQRRQTAATALHDTEDQLNTLLPKLEADTVRARIDGAVTGLSVFNPGSVVAPGQQLLEIVPDHPILTVQARLSPSNIQGVHVGQKAEVRFSSLGGNGIPILTGALTQVSADSFTDEKTGQRYYTAEVTVPKSQLALLGTVRDFDTAIRPGVPVDIMIPLSKRSAFEYLFGPLSQALWSGFRQR
jgi:HlyD family secretion protein